MSSCDIKCSCKQWNEDAVRMYMKRKSGHNALEISEAENDEDGQQIIQLNIAGKRFEVRKRTLTRRMEGALWEKINKDGEKRVVNGVPEIYFDRDPTVFKLLLLYCRNGRLHVDSRCTEILEAELAEWGIKMDDKMANCCLGKVMDARQRLKDLEEFEQVTYGGINTSLAGGWRMFSNAKVLGKIKKKIWTIVDRPTSNKMATMYSIILALITLFSIFIFISSTHESFRRIMTAEEAARLLGLNKNPNVSEISVQNIKGEVRPNMNRKNWTIPHEWLRFSDYICYSFFSFDIVLRTFSTPCIKHFFSSVYTHIDILSMVPFYFEQFYKISHETSAFQHAVEFRVDDYMDILKVCVILRFFRVARHYRGLRVLCYTLRSSSSTLFLLLSFLITAMMISSSFIYFAEYGDNSSRFSSIPGSCWWSVITMMTVGYGDVVPITNWGYFVATCTAVVGVVLMAFVVPVLVNNFLLFYSHCQTVEVLVERRQHIIRKIKLKRLLHKKKKKPSTQVSVNNDKQAETKLSREASNEPVLESVNVINNFNRV